MADLALALPNHVSRLATRLAATPVVVVGLIVALAAAATGYYAVQVENWFVMTDELLYQQLALDIGPVLADLPTSGDHSHGVKNVLYPLLIALPYNTLSTEAAYDVVHALNALFMASTAVPAYLLARAATLHRSHAYLVAALSTAVPWMSQSMLVWTEAVAYPAFVWCALAILKTVQRPSARGDLLALAALLVAYLARTQFLALAVAFPAVVLSHEIAFARGATFGARVGSALSSIVRGHRVACAAYLAGAVGTIALAIFSSVDELAGSYADTFGSDLFPGGFFDTFGHLLGQLAVGSAFLPLAAAVAWMVTTLVRPQSRDAHAAAVVVLLMSLAVLVTATSFIERFSGSVQDRYAFYVLPLLFVGLGGFIAQPRRYVTALLLGAGLTTWAVAQSSYEPGTQLFWASPVSYLDSVIDGRTEQAGGWFGFADLSGRTLVIAVTVVAAALLAAAALWRPRLAALALPLTLVYCASATIYISDRAFGSGYRAAANADWIDDAVPDGERATMVPGYTTHNKYLSDFYWWDTLFWNASIRHMYAFREARTYGYTPSSPLRLDWRTGELSGSGGSRFWVVPRGDVRFSPAGGRVLATDDILEVIEVAEPYRAAFATRNVYEDGWVPPKRPARIRVFGQGGSGAQRMEVRLALGSPRDITTDRRYRARFGGSQAGGIVGLGLTRHAVLHACVPANRYRDVFLHVPRGNRLPPPDSRSIGLSVTVENVRARGQCARG